MSPLIVIVGETASGKTALSIELAKQLGGEIICADSWTVYKGFDIGTAKPTAEEQQGIPHHLLDVADPAEGFSAAVFQKMAKQRIEEIAARGNMPIMVGGTGLYTDSILYDYSFLPMSDPMQREVLNQMSLDDLLQKAADMGLDTKQVDTRNKRRVIRLIENNGQMPTRQPLRSNTVILGIRRPVEMLRERIVQRVDEMVRLGLADEVARLGMQYGWDCEPMKAPAYRAFREYIEGTISLDEAKFRMVQNDLKLAKKQRTWFKRNSSIQWTSTDDSIEDICKSIMGSLNK